MFIVLIIKAIKNGLKKLRTKDADKYEKFITETVSKLKGGLKKTEAEDLLIEIGKKCAVIGGGMLIGLGLLALLGAAYVTMRKRGN